ncbi:MAG: RagB/SusD family nutrient uptake outer membrane protein [Tannerella sp.]|jgi:hypothetical protein|nr:RagB/SusD family nutrient uptake outer membrane protein [Tannerella sp.]
MKKIYLSIVCVSLLLFSACNNFLEEDPKNTLPAESIFSTLKTAEAAVNNLYRAGVNDGAFISPGVYNGTRSMMGGWSSGLFDNLNYKGQEIFIQYAQELEMTPNNVNSKMGELFNPLYQAIYRANAAIAVLPTVDLATAGISQADFDRLVAEARFFRAINYFYLVKHFGDVPMIVTPQSAADDLLTPKTDTKTIYEQVIIPDLQAAISTLPVRAQYENSMRITAPVASAYLVDVYVQMSGFPINDASKYASAAAEVKKFLPGGTYSSIYSLEDNEDFEELSAYNKLRSVNVVEASPGGRKSTSSSESIYTYEFESGMANNGINQNAWPMEVAALGTAECAVTLTNNAYKPMPRYLAMYDPAVDLRMKERQFFANSFDKKDGSLLINSELNTPSPYFYYDWGGVKIVNSSGRHWAIYRLAEMYLFAAEAIAQAEGVTAQAVDALATIRARAYEFGGVSKETIASQLSGLSKDQFVEQVWLERYRELVFEWKDWNMIQRTRKYPKTNAMDGSIPVGTAQFVDVTSVGPGFTTKNFSVDNLLWPFPLEQTQRNPNLTQNPGY